MTDICFYNLIVFLSNCVIGWYLPVDGLGCFTCACHALHVSNKCAFVLPSFVDLKKLFSKIYCLSLSILYELTVYKSFKAYPTQHKLDMIIIKKPNLGLVVYDSLLWPSMNKFRETPFSVLRQFVHNTNVS